MSNFITATDARKRGQNIVVIHGEQTTIEKNILTTMTSTSGNVLTVSITDNIQHTGDTNTQIRFPEADTITFEANGFEQVRIDNDVQMFVQANSKQSKLQLHREDVSINADDVVGQITFTGRDSGGAGIQRVGAQVSQRKE